jgi:hypothetical protein
VTRHIDLVGLLYIFAGGLSALVAGASLSLGLGALSLVWTAESERSGLAAGVAASLFLALGVALLAWAAVNAWAGRQLRDRRPWGRLAGLVLALVHLFVLPFGTALGVYSLWVLVHNEARLEFEPGRGAPT